MYAIAILLAGLFLYFALRGLDWAAFLAVLRNANYRLIPLIFLWSSISSWIRALRWRVLLTVEQNIPAVNVFWANMAGYLGNNILPARAGEWIRASYVSTENDLSFLFCLATGLVERLVDLIALVVLGFLALAVSGLLSASFQYGLKLMSIVAAVGLVVLLVMPYFGGRVHKILQSLPILNASIKEKLGGWVDHFLDGIAALHQPVRAGTFLLLTGLIWLLDGIGVILLAHSLHLQFSLIEAFLLLAGLGLSSAIPSTPGYIGIYQFVAVVVLQPFGISNASAVALIIFLQVASFLIIAFWGGIALWRAAYLSKPVT
jgi:glycosyltransferase 2 family protein